MTRLGIVVVNYGSVALLETGLATIDRSALGAHRVVVVDNPTEPPDPDERRTLRSLAATHAWELVEPTTNLGFGGGMNVGVARAIALGCDQFLLLNPDVSITADQILGIAARSEARPDTVFSPRLLRGDGELWFAGGQLDLQVGLTRSRPDLVQEGRERWLTGACMVLHRRCWELADGFDTRYFLYWEDVDLSQRVLERGGDLEVVHDVEVVHAVGATQRVEGKSTVYGYHMCRNRLLFATGHVDRRAQLRWLLASPRYAWRILLRHGRRRALGRPDMVVAVVKGTLAGVAELARAAVRPRR